MLFNGIVSVNGSHIIGGLSNLSSCDWNISSNNTTSGHIDTSHYIGNMWVGTCMFTFTGRKDQAVQIVLLNYKLR